MYIVFYLFIIIFLFFWTVRNVSQIIKKKIWIKRGPPYDLYWQIFGRRIITSTFSSVFIDRLQQNNVSRLNHSCLLIVLYAKKDNTSAIRTIVVYMFRYQTIRMIRRRPTSRVDQTVVIIDPTNFKTNTRRRIQNTSERAYTCIGPCKRSNYLSNFTCLSNCLLVCRFVWRVCQTM